MKKPINCSRSAPTRRSFRQTGLAAGTVTAGAELSAQGGTLTTGDAAILRFLAAAEILETDFWTQYNELGGIQDSEVPGGTGSHKYTKALEVLDADMPQYIHDNTEEAFHFASIEQGGSSLYPSLAQRVTSVEVLRILLSIGPTETAHFQTWHDKAGNAPPLTDPSDRNLVFPDLNKLPFGGEDFQTNLIMPEPCPFLSRMFPVCSIIRPTETKGAAMGAVKFLTASGLFLWQPPAFFQLLQDLATAADAATRGA